LARFGAGFTFAAVPLRTFFKAFRVDFFAINLV
jgi:hypothetical protein